MDRAIEERSDLHPLRFLVVCATKRQVQALRSILPRGSFLRVARSAATARVAAPCSGYWDGLVLDTRAGRDDVLQLLAEVRGEGCRTPALVLLDGDDREGARAAHRRQALSVPVPVLPEHIDAFRRHIRDHHLADADTQEHRLRLLARAHGLTPQELNVVRLLSGSMTRAQVAQRLDISPTTLRTLCDRVRRRAGLTSLHELIVQVRGGGGARDEDEASGQLTAGGFRKRPE